MQALAGLRNGAAGSPHNRGRHVGNGHKPGNKAAEAKVASAARKRNGFLTGRLLPVASGLLVETDGMKADVATMANLDYLYRSAANYARLLGVRLKFNCKKYARHPKLGMAELYRAFDAIVSENVNIELDGGRLVFCLYRFSKWSDYEVLWLPLDFTANLSKGVRRVTLEFIRRFARHHGMRNITGSYHYSMAEDSFHAVMTTSRTTAGLKPDDGGRCVCWNRTTTAGFQGFSRGWQAGLSARISKRRWSPASLKAKPNGHCSA